MNARKLTDSDLNSIQTKMEELNAKIQSKSVTAEEALKLAYAERDLLRETLDRNDISDLRKDTWAKVQEAIEAFGVARFDEERAAGAKFKPGSALDLAATKRVNDVKKLIRTMSLNAQVRLTKDEAYFAGKKLNGDSYKEGDQVNVEIQARAHISMVHNFGKYIDSEHSAMKELWQMYNDKTISNYMQYAKDLPKRKELRDGQLAQKIKKNLDQYSDKNLAQAVLTLLEPVIPTPEKKDESPKDQEGPRNRKQA